MIEILGLVVNFLTLIAVILSVWYVTRQIQKEHEWNRRKSAQDLADRLIEGELSVVRRKLESIARWYDLQHTYDNVTGQVTDGAELDHLVKSYLNFLEGIALGIKHGVYDEEIAFQYFGSLLPEVFRWSKPFVQKRRNLANTTAIYIETEVVALRWRKRINDLQDHVEKAAVPPGRPRL